MDTYRPILRAACLQHLELYTWCELRRLPLLFPLVEMATKNGGGGLPQKRPCPTSSLPASSSPSAVQRLNESEQKVYNLILSRADMGIFAPDIKHELASPTLLHRTIDKILKALESKSLIKQVISMKHRSKKLYMASQFEPLAEIAGGVWHANGALDLGYINVYRDLVKFCLDDCPNATFDEIHQYVKSSKAVASVTEDQTRDIIGSLILDGKIEEIPNKLGKVSYRWVKKDKLREVYGVFTSIPCGVCPRIGECSPDGLISPETCVYYNRWLNINF